MSSFLTRPLLDTDGNQIQAHGGGLLRHHDRYYWYGENKDADTDFMPLFGDDLGYRTDVVGVSCYHSADLIHWENGGVVLHPVPDNEFHDLHPSRVCERPKVIFCPATGEFVMWLHLDRLDYSFAAVGIAVADNPLGPFTLVQTLRPGGSDSRDQTLFIDDDGTAYHICSTDQNKTTLISRLTPDFRSLTSESKRIFIDRYMEAPCICKSQGRYWFLASGCTGWDPNAARSAVADSIWGPWEELKNPCEGEGADLTYGTQSTYLFALPESGSMIAMFDEWKKEDLRDSRYLWLPAEIDMGRMRVKLE